MAGMESQITIDAICYYEVLSKTLNPTYNYFYFTPHYQDYIFDFLQYA